MISIGFGLDKIESRIYKYGKHVVEYIDTIGLYGPDLYNTCKYNNKNKKYANIKLLISKGTTDWNDGLYIACLGSYIDIIGLMISKGSEKTDEYHKLSRFFNKIIVKDFDIIDDIKPDIIKWI